VRRINSALIGSSFSAVIRRAYAGMALTEALLQDESKQDGARG
jgi:hypothetical protein